MSCGAPLYSYSRFRDDGDDGMDDESSGGGAMILVIVIVLVLVVAGVCCWCFARRSGGCGGGACARTGRVASVDGGAGAVEVTDHKQLAEHGSCVVMFYATWCGHCKAAKPAYHEAASKASIPFLMVDCENVLSREQMAKYVNGGYPTFSRLSNGNVVNVHDGPRTVEAFVEFSKA